jgi:hypothetical protein
MMNAAYFTIGAVCLLSSCAKEIAKIAVRGCR